MKQKTCIAALAIGLAATNLACTDVATVYEAPANIELRAPAYPLISIDPYTSGWSFNDNLYDGPIRHWTGSEQQLLGVINVDGKSFRFMGEENLPMQLIVPTFEKEPWDALYTTTRPTGNWMAPEYTANWKEGKGAFGSPGRLKAMTDWRTTDIWVRREVNIDADMLKRDLFLEYSHDDGVEIYINGHQVINTGNSARAGVMHRIPDDVKAMMHPGKNLIAAHCNDGGGESYLDFGIWMRKDNQQRFANTAHQTNVDVLPTRTFYTFEAGGVQLELIFTAPLLMDDLNLMSRPVNYITYQVKSIDGQPHNVSVTIEGSSQWAQNAVHQQMESSKVDNAALHLMKSGTTQQPVLAKSGDNIRIDWGYVYMAAPKNPSTTIAVTPIDDAPHRLAIEYKLGQVDNTYTTGYAMLAYDDVYSIQYFGQNLRPYWNRKGDNNIVTQIEAAARDYAAVMARCDAFDRQMMAEATAAGGTQYAELCALAYRQSVHAHKLVEAPNGDLLWLSKENFSNGSIGTVDVTYPSAPLFLCYNPELAKGLLNHIFFYSESGKWTKPFAAHDVGTYPLANGQTYGGDMPVEESGNMLALTAAIAAIEGNADYAARHWDVLTIWTDYLVEKGLDPENQLCTDDFAGHFAHNINLSAKAIMGIASYGYLAEMLGKADVAKKYTATARQMAEQWMQMADDGDHYRLTFDKAGTWSQKYNLIWNKILKLNIFPASVMQKEIPYYLTKQNKYGLPLDSRRNYTKSDWIMWTATLADDDATFRKFIAPVYKFYNETTDRVPMSDWYNTDATTHVGFQARSVVGGYFIKVLADRLK